MQQKHSVFSNFGIVIPSHSSSGACARRRTAVSPCGTPIITSRINPDGIGFMWATAPQAQPRTFCNPAWITSCAFGFRSVLSPPRSNSAFRWIHQKADSGQSHSTIRSNESNMKASHLLFIFYLPLLAVHAEPSWTKQDGRFATLETPSAMVRDNKHIAIDSIQEVYMSPGISLAFESETTSIPPVLQKQLEQAVVAWAWQRKQNWAKDIHVKDNAKMDIALVSAGYYPKDYPERPHYLYLGFCAVDSTFCIHVRFRSLDNLNDIERMLKSIKLKIQ